MRHSTLACGWLLSLILIGSHFPMTSCASKIQEDEHNKTDGQLTWKDTKRLWEGKTQRRPSLKLSTFIRKSLPAQTKNVFSKPSDPLHAYPNQVDLTVHTLFQRLATFEVNNAATVRSVLNSVRVAFWIGLALGIVGVAVPIATALPALARRRSWPALNEKRRLQHSFEYRHNFDQLAQSIYAALQSQETKYHF